MRRTLLATVFALLGAALVRPSESRANPQPSYRANMQRWHNAENVPAPQYTDDGRLVLRLRSINALGTVEVTPRTPEGGFDEEALTQVSRVLGDARAQRSAPIDRRLVEVIYQIARHFRAGQISVLSGFRAQTAPSNHRLGRAVDILVPGVADADVAAYARTLGFLGVGYYPVGGFTHVDVRDRSYYWVDRSGPGSPSRARRGRSRRRGRSSSFCEVHGDVARRADQEARARGIFPYGGLRGPSNPGNGSAAASGVREAEPANGAAPATPAPAATDADGDDNGAD